MFLNVGFVWEHPLLSGYTIRCTEHKWFWNSSTSVYARAFQICTAAALFLPTKNLEMSFIFMHITEKFARRVMNILSIVS